MLKYKKWETKAKIHLVSKVCPSKPVGGEGESQEEEEKEEEEEGGGGEVQKSGMSLPCNHR